MNKKYKIINSNNENDSICNLSILSILIYIILFSIIFYLIYKLIFQKENFENFVDTENNNNQAIIEELKQENKELSEIKSSLENKAKLLDRANFLTNNFDKLNEESGDMLSNDIYSSFAKINIPQVDINNYRIILNQNDLSAVISNLSNYKNFYKPGEIVTMPSSEIIDKNIICYQNKGKVIETDPEFLEKYPQCMVCSVNNSPNLTETIGWKNTKTNISEVCLFNPDPDVKFPVASLEDCKKMCKINS